MKIFRNSHTFGVKITERCEFSVPVAPFGTDISTLQAVTKVTKITKGDRPLLEPLLELQKLTHFDVKSQKSVSFLLQKGTDPYLNFKNSHLLKKITERCEFSVPVALFGTDISPLQVVTKVIKGDRPLLELQKNSYLFEIFRFWGELFAE